MKKILLICNHFAPDNTIAAIRITKLAKYFVKEGFYVKVIAEKRNESLEDEILKKDAAGIDVIRISNSDKCIKKLNHYKKLIAPHKNKRLSRLDNRIRINPKTGKEEFYPYETAYPFWGALDYILDNYRQKDLFRQSKKVLDNELNYDVVITSYGDKFGIYAGHYMKNKNKEITWVFDIRDAICRYKFVPKYVMWHARLQQKGIEKKADKIVAVSKGIAKGLSEKCRDKVCVITNGYDISDRDGITIKSDRDNKLKFTYTGSMYGGIRDLSPFFKAIGELLAENVMSESTIGIAYAGNKPAYEIFLSQAKKYGVEKVCEYKGKLTRMESLELQMNSDVLLISSYDYVQGEGGVITGKTFEYMSAGKPMIAIISGDIVNSELRQIIEKCELGCVYEESAQENDLRKLKEYVKQIYNQFVKEKAIRFEPNYDNLKNYDYVNISKKYKKLIEEKEKI